MPSIQSSRTKFNLAAPRAGAQCAALVRRERLVSARCAGAAPLFLCEIVLQRMGGASTQPFTPLHLAQETGAVAAITPHPAIFTAIVEVFFFSSAFLAWWVRIASGGGVCCPRCFSLHRSSAHTHLQPFQKPNPCSLPDWNQRSGFGLRCSLMHQ